MPKPPGLLSRIGTAMAFVGGRDTDLKSGSVSGGGLGGGSNIFDQLLGAVMLHRQSRSGTSVGLDTALRLAIVMSCTRSLAEGVAGLPWKLMRHFDDGRRVYETTDPLYDVLYRQPNDWQTSYEFREQLMFHAVLTGNGYAYINRDGANKVQELIPIAPNRVRVRQAKDSTVTYDVADATGQIMHLAKEMVFHVRGPSWDGVVGMDIVQMARESIGLAIGLEETSADMHRNGLQTSGIISMKGPLQEKARERLRERIKEMAVEDRHGVLILDQEATFTRMVMSSMDAQTLESRNFQIDEICRIMRVYPQMVMASSRAMAGSGIEQYFLAHVMFSLTPWVDRWEQAAHRDLIGRQPATATDNGELQAKMSLQGLMRGDAAQRAAFYASGIQNGWLTRADARDFEDLPGIKGLDEPLMPANLMALSSQGAATQARQQQIATAPAGQPTGGRGAGVERRLPPSTPSAVARLLASELADEVLRAEDFAPGELEAKIGRILSGANERQIMQARDILNGVLAQLATQPIA
jgi:HK97 family phage portal protein